MPTNINLNPELQTPRIRPTIPPNTIIATITKKAIFKHCVIWVVSIFGNVAKKLQIPINVNRIIQLSLV